MKQRAINDGTGIESLREDCHPRTFRQNTYVYPVLSRRSEGISIGINLNPDKVCNFDCIYCQVDRTRKPQEYFVGLPALLQELASILTGLSNTPLTLPSPPGGEGKQLPACGALWREPEFLNIAADKRHVADIAFSGDGEPTTFKNFAEVVQRCVELKESMGFTESKVVLITNATGLDRPDVRRGLRFLDTHRGEVWAKLDAGTPEYFALIDKTDFPFQRVLDNISHCAREREIVIQSCFMRVRGAGPGPGEVTAFIGRLREIVRHGGRIRLVQVYTVARDPALAIVSSLSDAEVDAITGRVRGESGLAAQSYYGNVAEGRGRSES